MKPIFALLAALLVPALATGQPAASAPTEVPILNLTTTASMQVDNDRMTILAQAESEKPNAAQAAAEVNARMAKALATAKAVSNATARTLNYTTDQVYEKGKFVRWRVTQSLEVVTADFAAGANLATRLQEDGLNLAGLTFGVSAEAKHKAMAKLQNEALVEWQSLAAQGAASMGYPGYRAGRVTVSTGDTGPRPRYAMAAMAAAPASPPVAAAAGSSELMTTVTGEAILMGPRKP